MLSCNCISKRLIACSAFLIRLRILMLSCMYRAVYEVSRFPHVGSHFGAYQKGHFELVETVMHLSTPIVNKYLARVVKPPVTLLPNIRGIH